MVEHVVSFINSCISFLPYEFEAVIIGFIGYVAADGLVGVVSRAWRILGR